MEPALGEGNKSYASSKRSRQRHCRPSQLLGVCAQTETRINNEEYCRDNLELARTEDNHSEDAASEVTTEPGIYCCLFNLPVLEQMQTSKHSLRARIWTKPVRSFSRCGIYADGQSQMRLLILKVWHLCRWSITNARKILIVMSYILCSVTTVQV